MTTYITVLLCTILALVILKNKPKALLAISQARRLAHHAARPKIRNKIMHSEYYGGSNGYGGYGNGYSTHGAGGTSYNGGPYSGPGGHTHHGVNGTYSGPDSGCPYCPHGHSGRGQGGGRTGPYLPQSSRRRRTKRSFKDKYIDWALYFFNSTSIAEAVIKTILLILGVIAGIAFIIFITIDLFT